MFRTILFFIVLIFITVFCSLVAIIGGIFNPFSRIVNWAARFWTKTLLFTAGTKLEVHGLENIDPEKQYIFMSNHQSHFDVFAIFSILDRTVRFIAKKELFRIPVFGWALYLSGTVRVDRTNRQRAIESLRKAFEKNKDKVSLIIFPEGTRSPDGHIKNFKKGGFVMSIDTELPVVPISISGTRKILPKNSMRIKPGKVKIVISQPVEPADYNYKTREKYAEKVRNIIVEKYEYDY